MKTKRPPISFYFAAAILAFASVVLIEPALGASATWSTNPQSSDWNTASNWVPMTVPNGPNDTATFQASNQRDVSLSANTEVNGIIFNPDAGNFTINNNAAFRLTISGTGITNNSGTVQALTSGQMAFTNAASAGVSNYLSNTGSMTFSNLASAGSAHFVNYPGSSIMSFSGSSTAANATFTNSANTSITFSGSSTAANATFTNPPDGSITFSGSSTAGAATFTESYNSGMTFSNSATAGSANITLRGCCQPAAPESDFAIAASGNTALSIDGANPNGAYAAFYDSSSAANAMITVNGSQPGNGVPGARLFFYNTSNAGASTVINNGGTGGGGPGVTEFLDNSTGDMSLIKVFGNGSLNISGHAAPGVTVGSIEGDGLVLLGGNTFTVGTNNASTIFSGQIQDNFGSGRFVKTGTGTLVLTNANSSIGGISIDGGVLQASHDLALGISPQNGGYVSVGSNGTLTLDSGAMNNYIGDRNCLLLVDGSVVNLNFVGAPDRIRSLIVNGVPQPPGVYGAPGSSAPNRLPQFTGTGTILATTKAVSRLTHGSAGAFDIDLPLAGSPGIECRTGGGTGGDYQIVLTFYNPVTFNSAAIVAGSGQVASTGGNGTDTVVLNLTNVANAQTISVAVFDLNDGTLTTTLVVPMGVLIGDVNANRVVNASDIVAVKTVLGQPVSGSNFRSDVNPNGVINASDVIKVKTLSGTSLP